MTFFGKASHPQSGVYWWGDESFTAVTSILGALNKPALPAAAAKEVAIYAEQNWDVLGSLEPASRIALMKGAASRKWGAAAEIGTETHRAVAAMLENDEEFPPHLAGFRDAWFGFLALYRVGIEYNEVTVYNRKCGYAGTLDLIADIDGVSTLIDIKTGGVWPEAGLQVNAYANGEFIGMDGKEVPMPKVQKLAILQLASTGSHNLVPVRFDDEMFRSFRHVIEAHRFTKLKNGDIFHG